jgi:hypothetical protein
MIYIRALEGRPGYTLVLSLSDDRATAEVTIRYNQGIVAEAQLFPNQILRLTYLDPSLRDDNRLIQDKIFFCVHIVRVLQGHVNGFRMAGELMTYYAEREQILPIANSRRALKRVASDDNDNDFALPLDPPKRHMAEAPPPVDADDLMQDGPG